MGGGGPTDPPVNAPLASCDWSPKRDAIPGALGNGFPASRGAAGRLPGPPGGIGRPAIMLSNGRGCGGLGRLPLKAPPGSCDWSPKRDASGEGGPLRPGGASLPIMGAGGPAPAREEGGPAPVRGDVGPSAANSCGGRVRGRLPPKDGRAAGKPSWLVSPCRYPLRSGRTPCVEIFGPGSCTPAVSIAAPSRERKLGA
jgi:hypothetical protein